MPPLAAAFARDVITEAGPAGRERAKNLLWAAGKLADYGIGLAAAAEEARAAAQAVTTDARLAEVLTQVSVGTWEPPASGISLDPCETVAAVLWCATRATSLRSGLVSAVQLGGDTDTVAALVGGLMGSTLTAEQVHADLPWHQLVVLPEPETAIAETAAALATTRAIQSV